MKPGYFKRITEEVKAKDEDNWKKSLQQKTSMSKAAKKKNPENGTPTRENVVSAPREPAKEVAEKESKTRTSTKAVKSSKSSKASKASTASKVSNETTSSFLPPWLQMKSDAINNTANKKITQKKKPAEEEQPPQKKSSHKRVPFSEDRKTNEKKERKRTERKNEVAKPGKEKVSLARTRSKKKIKEVTNQDSEKRQEKDTRRWSNTVHDKILIQHKKPSFTRRPSFRLRGGIPRYTGKDWSRSEA